MVTIICVAMRGVFMRDQFVGDSSGTQRMIIDPALPVFSEICTFCKHWIVSADRSCAAFATIPVEIWMGENDHTKPYPGDGGIVFERISQADLESGAYDSDPEDDPEAVKGGAGSGNFRHRGRPGERGGSAPGDGPAQDTPAARRAAYQHRIAARQVEPHVTGLLRTIATKEGGKLAGLQHRIKQTGSLARKIASDAKEKGVPEPKVAAEINDILRYTLLFPNENFVQETSDAIRTLEQAGFSLFKAKNYFGAQEYKGLNAVFVQPKTGVKFELQFHTPETIETKEESHKIYSKVRVMPDGPEKDRLIRDMTELWRKTPVPANWEKLPGVKL